VATDVLAQKYFRKAGVPADSDLETVDEADVPTWLRRRVPKAGAKLVGEKSAKQVFDRLAAPGPTGAGKAAISTPKPTRARSSTRCATLLAAQMARPIRRNGSTPACTGLTASTARRRVTTTSISRPETGQIQLGL